jgi:hypothetical protein
MKVPKPRKPPNPTKPAKSYALRIPIEMRARCDAATGLEGAPSIQQAIEWGLAAGPIPWRLANVAEAVGKLGADVARLQEGQR